VKTLMVDGYNLIHANPRLSDIVDRDLDAAREDLLKELTPLAYPDYYHLVMVVFDAAGSHQSEPVVEDREGIELVFTRRGQSADSFIEAAVRYMVSDGEVEVVTNDRMLAGVVSGFGARVMDGASLLGMAQRALLETREDMRRMSQGRRAPLEDRVGEEIRLLLDKMRYQ
jgi:uncharacterized protein